MRVRIKKQIPVKGQRQDLSWIAYRLIWPVYEYEIIPDWNPRFLSLIPKHLWPEGGVFAVKGQLTIPKINGFPKRYNPVEEADQIIRDVMNIVVSNPAELLRFTNKWGVLEGGYKIEGVWVDFDSVVRTGKYIELFQFWMRGISKLQEGSNDTASWNSLADFLSVMLAEIRLGVHPAEQGIEPVFKVPRLLDSISLELWNRITKGKRIQKCPECENLFFPGRANQEYCSRLCANRPTVRRAKHKKRAIKLRKTGMPIKIISEKIREELKTVKSWLKEKSHGKSKR
jgi:hypothetical protein